MKCRVAVPRDAMFFLDHLVSQGHYLSRSAALTDAIYTLRDARLRAAYDEAFAYGNESIWDETVADGLS
jgi:Arc/MetJ-type ribon-helix-helix transcriptional regulator